MTRTVLILGGYGITGSRIAELLLQDTDVKVLIGGRQLAEAKRVADRLGRKVSGDRVLPILADAQDFKLLSHAFESADIVVVASSTAAHVRTVAQAAVETGTDYFDIQGSSSKVRYLESVAEVIRQNGRCFISDGGLHPGLPAALVRFAAGFMDRVQRANVASVIQLDWQRLAPSAATFREFAEQLPSYRPRTYRQGKWIESWRERRDYAFGAPFGTRSVRPVHLDEMRFLPEMYPSLVESGYYLAGFNGFVDSVAMPLGWLAMRVIGAGAVGPVSRSLEWGLRRFRRPPFGAVFLIEAKGWKKGRLVAVRGSVTHGDGYALTAIPVVACLLQYLDGTIRRPGLWYQALTVQPRRFLTDIERLGAKVEYQLDVET